MSTSASPSLPLIIDIPCFALINPCIRPTSPLFHSPSSEPFVEMAPPKVSGIDYAQICGEEVREITGIKFADEDDREDPQRAPTLDFSFPNATGWKFGESAHQAPAPHVINFY